MALKFTDKLKGLELGKGKEALSEATSSVSKLFSRKNQETDTSNVNETAEIANKLDNVLDSSINPSPLYKISPQLNHFYMYNF